jgi:hypothetical protein
VVLGQGDVICLFKTLEAIGAAVVPRFNAKFDSRRCYFGLRALLDGFVYKASLLQLHEVVVAVDARYEAEGFTVVRNMLMFKLSESCRRAAFDGVSFLRLCGNYGVRLPK